MFKHPKEFKSDFMNEYRYIPNDHYNRNKFRLFLILSILYALFIFVLSHMYDPVSFFMRLLS